MRSFNRILLERYLVAAAILLFLLGGALGIFGESLPTWAMLLLAGGLTLIALSGVTVWTNRSLSADLKEIGSALEKIVLENDLDRMPQPRLTELSDLARDLDTIAQRVRENIKRVARQRDRLDAILSNISAGIIVIGRAGKISIINPAAERILGTSVDQAIGKAFTEIHHTRAIDTAIELSMAGNEVNEEVDISLPRERTLRVLASPVRDKSGKASGVVCILEDVTSRRKLERMRRDFVANVSHELRTPVANLQAVADALQAGALDDREKALKFIADIDSEAQRLAGIIEDLLVLSRMEAEESAFTEVMLDLNELLGEVATDKAALAERESVELVPPVEGRLTVYGDAKILRTAFANLVDNALKYNRPGGRVELAALSTGETVTVTVTDTGIGIPRTDQSKIFERFYRVDKARSRETGGTGLGLSIVRHSIELHGGTVSVESTEGKGSKFTIVLPSAGR
jgi:two-component system, OmpR family, phosphate regulon sensor histidine kinase PhoR